MPTKLVRSRFIQTNIDDVPMLGTRRYKSQITRSESEDPNRAIVIDAALLKLYTKQKALKQDIEH